MSMSNNNNTRLETSDNENLPEYSFSLKKIQLVEKTLSLVPKKENQDDYDFDISLKITLDPIKKCSIHFMNVGVRIKSDNRKVASVSIVCFFEINNFDQLVTNDQNELTLPQSLLNLLNTVVIGTVRGITYSEFRGTALDNAILPVLDPRKFQKKLENN